MLVSKVTASGKIRPAQMVTLAKLHHVLTRLPLVCDSVVASVSVCSPRSRFGEIETYHWWDFEVKRDLLKISSGGHFYDPTTGGDTFTSMTWDAVPVHPPEFHDFSESLGVVPDLRPFLEGVEAFDFTSRDYKIEILDSDNPLLEEGLEEDEHDESVEGFEAEESGGAVR